MAAAMTVAGMNRPKPGGRTAAARRRGRLNAAAARRPGIRCRLDPCPSRANGLVAACPPPQHSYPDNSRYNGRPDERGAGPDHGFYRGQRLPGHYRARQYVIDDWRGHRLSAPPRGYHWVQVGSDYVLVAIATGIILQLLLSQ